MTLWELFKRGTIEVPIPLTADWRTDVQTDVKAYRSGDVVTVVAWRLAVNAGVTGSVDAYTLPPGFRPPPLFTDRTTDSRGAAVALGVSGTVQVTNPATAVSHHSFTFVTRDAMPTGGA